MDSEERKELLRRIRLAEKHKRKVIGIQKDLFSRYKKGEISYYEYGVKLDEVFQGKKLKDWVDYYDSYISRCKRLLTQEGFKVRLNFIRVAPLVLLGLLIFGILGFFYFGFVAKAPVSLAPPEDSYLSERVAFLDGKFFDETSGKSLDVEYAQYGAVAGSDSPVKWGATISSSNPSELKAALPDSAFDVSVLSVEGPVEEKTEKIVSEETGGPVGEGVIVDNGNKTTGTVSTAINRTAGNETNNTVGGADNVSVGAVGEIDEGGLAEDILLSPGASGENIFLAGKGTKALIEFYTPSVGKNEEVLENSKKRVRVVNDNGVNYRKVKIVSEIDSILQSSEKGKFRIINEKTGEIVLFDIQEINGEKSAVWFSDMDANTEESFLIILITKAEHLDGQRVFVSDVYESVKELDGVWSEEIPDGDYVRVVFERSLTSENDITLFPRIVSGTPRIEVYEKDGSEVIAEFESLTDGVYNKVFLTGLKGGQDSFDLKILGGGVEFDHIIDPVGVTFCQNLDQDNEVYQLVNNITINSGNYVNICFRVSGENVTLDGQGHTLYYDHTASAVGVKYYFWLGRNLTLKNINIGSAGGNYVSVGDESSVWPGAPLIVSDSNLEFVDVHHAGDEPGGDVIAVNSNIDSIHAYGRDCDCGVCVPGSEGVNEVLLINSSAKEILTYSGETGQGGNVTIISDFINLDNSLINATGNDDSCQFGVTHSPGTLTLNYSSGFTDVGANYGERINLHIIDRNFGEIFLFGDNYSSSLDSSSFTDLSSNIQISNNFVSFDGVALPGLNHSARITLYDVPVIPDAVIMKNNQPCSPSECVSFTPLSGDVVFSVEESGSYRIGTAYRLSIDVLRPVSERIDVVQNTTFDVEFEISCSGGDCGNVNVALDPTKPIILNGDFEKGDTSFWSEGGNRVPEVTNVDSYDGIYSLNIINFGCCQSTTSVLTQEFTETDLGTNLDFYAKGEVEEGFDMLKVFVEDSSGVWNFLTDLDGQIFSDWTLVSLDISSYGFVKGVRFEGYNDDGVGSSMLIDAVCLADGNGNCVEAVFKGIVPTVRGEIPFYTFDLNPQQISLANGQSQTVRFNVNATGEIGSEFEFFGFAQFAESGFVANESAYWNVSIVDELPTISVEGCMNLDQANKVYVQTANIIVDSNPCINIIAENVTFDGDGYSIRSNILSATGISSAQPSTTIRNTYVRMAGGGNAIFISDTHNASVYDNVLDSSSFGISLSAVSNSWFSGNTANHSTSYGIYLKKNSNNNIFEGNILDSNRINLVLTSGSNNNLFRNNIITSGTQYGLAFSGVSDNVVDGGLFDLNVGDSVRISSGARTVVRNVVVDNSAGNAVHVLQSAQNTTLSNVSVANTGPLFKDLLLDAGIGEVNLFDNYLEEYTFNTNFVTFGDYDAEVRFLEPVTGSGVNLSDDVQLNHNSVLVKGENNPGLNRGANVTLYGLPGNFEDPVILRDGSECSDCYSYTPLNSVDVVFNVTGFSIYSIGERVGGSPVIVDIEDIPDQQIVEGGVRDVSFYVEVRDGNGWQDISNVEASFVSPSGSVIREDLNCDNPSVVNPNTARYSCNIGLQYHDEPGQWDVTASAVDSGGLTSLSYGETFVLWGTKAVGNPLGLSWSGISPGVQEIMADGGAFTLVNYGNEVISQVFINAAALVGESNPVYTIPAESFGVNTISQCGGTSLIGGSNVLIPGVSLPVLGQSDLYFCLEQAPQTLSSQSYSSQQNWDFTLALIAGLLVHVFVLPVSVSRKRGRKLRELVEGLSNDELLGILSERLRLSEAEEKSDEKIPVSIFKEDISPAEVLCKYLKENLNMRFNEIAEVIGRNQRTVWVNYNNSVKKKKKKIEIKKKSIGVPISVFGDRKFSVLESAVRYLREKGFRNSEISELLGKDPKNIWTIYSRVRKKRGNE